MKHVTHLVGAIILCTTPTLALAGGNSCCHANGTPGCDWPECEAMICTIDPYCCDTLWDGACGTKAQQYCSPCGGYGCGEAASGSCYQNNGSPSCDDPQCCADMCAMDPFCCDVTWDLNCALAAAEMCGGCGVPAAGPCCEPNGTPGCGDEDCCEFICVSDPICCEVEWDAQCVTSATTSCDADACGVAPGACCVPGGGCTFISEAECIASGGAFEGAGVACAQGSCCDGDVNGDGVVNSVDLNIVLSNFGCGQQ